jgi:hypothetical protein
MVQFYGGFESAIYNSVLKVALPFIMYFAIIQIYGFRSGRILQR